MMRNDCSLPETHTLVQDLLEVVSDPDTADQEGRHMVLLEVFLHQTGDRIKLADLNELCYVLRFFVGKAEIYNRYRYPFLRVIQLLKRPPLMSKSSDEIEHQTGLIQLFDTLGCFLLETKYEELIPHLFEVVEGIVLEPRAPNEAPATVCLRALEISFFMECLADFIAMAQPDFYLGAISIGFDICSKSGLCCWALLRNDIIETLLLRLTMTKKNEREDTLHLTYQLLRTLFNSTSHKTDWRNVTTPSVTALRGHRYVLREEALLYKKSLCDVAAITLKMIQIFPDANYVQSGLFEDIVFSATMTEAAFQNMVRMLPYFKSNNEYIPLKKLMLACICVVPMTSASVEILDQYRVPACLVAMLHGTSVYGDPVDWVPEDEIDLYKTALNVISVLFPHLPQRFIESRLTARLVQFLKGHYIKENHIPDELAFMTVKTTLMLCSCKNKEASCKALIDVNAVSILIDMCENVLKSQYNLTILVQSILSTTLCVLSMLMKSQREQQEKNAGTCLYIQSALYKRILQPLPNDSLLDNRLVVAICNFAWEVIVSNPESVSTFISSGEIYSHIDILERSAFSTQLVFLSMLVDLSEIEQSVPYLVSWRGRKGKNLFSLLCDIWRAEEGHILVPRDENGCISDIERPLMGENQFNLRNKKSKTSLCDVFGSARPKIYAIVQILRRQKVVADMCEEQYKLGYDQVPHEDRVTMQLVEAYLPLKMGEIWWEIRERQGNVLPLDRYLADTLADRYLNWSLRVQGAQFAILEDRDDRWKKEEQQFYSQLRAGRLSSTLEALREVVAIAKSADRRILLQSHRKAMGTIAVSRAREYPDLKLTYFEDMPVLVVNSKTDLVIQNETEHRPMDS